MERSTYAKYESGVSRPKNEILIELSKFYNVSVDYILEITDKKEKPTPIEGGGLSEAAQRFMPLVDRLTPEQQELLLAQLQAWTEQNQKQALAARQSDEGKVPKSDF